MTKPDKLSVNNRMNAENIALVIANERRRQYGNLPPMTIRDLKKDSCWKGLLLEGKAIMEILNE